MTTRRKTIPSETKKDNRNYYDKHPKIKNANSVNYKTQKRGFSAAYDIEDWLDLERELPH